MPHQDVKEKSLRVNVFYTYGTSRQSIEYSMKGVSYTDKKKKKTFLIYKELQMGSGAKSYMRKGFLIYEEMRKIFPYIWGGR